MRCGIWRAEPAIQHDRTHCTWACALTRAPMPQAPWATRGGRAPTAETVVRPKRRQGHVMNIPENCWLDRECEILDVAKVDAEIARLRAGLDAAIRAANLALFVINKHGVMTNSSWEGGFKDDLATATTARGAGQAPEDRNACLRRTGRGHARAVPTTLPDRRLHGRRSP